MHTPADGTAASEPGPAGEAVSRRVALRRMGSRAAAVGVAAWIVPEIVIGTQTAAGALSAPPGVGVGGSVGVNVGGTGGTVGVGVSALPSHSSGGWLLQRWSSDGGAGPTGSGAL